MAKQKSTTKATNRYRYSSFKDKIDDLRIEPARNLEKRVHDYVETSHFLASFEHWRDINMSGDFAIFADEVENLVQTLPQILYHEEKIFQALETHINNHDDKSLQPLLDLLSQFCHDLGPDFMKFYERALTSLIKLLNDATEFETSNVFEWGFNCLAYIFKYLSRSLCKDLLTTFNLLFPLLSHSKDYLSRFSAEALSFLIRKSNSKNLSEFISYSFKKLCDVESNNFYDGLQTLFDESLKTTKDTLHSKSNTIVAILLDEALNDNQGAVCVSLFADILMDILRHTASENTQSLYDSILSKLDEHLSRKTLDLDRASKVLAALVFAESGKKVPDWSILMASVQKVIIHENRATLIPETVAFLFSVILRNADVKSLTQFHKKIFEFYMETFPSHYVEFFKIALDLDRERLFSFSGAKYLQKYINSQWKDNSKKISLLLLQLEDRHDIIYKLNFTIPDDFSNYMLESLPVYSDVSSDDNLFEILWRLPTLRRADVDNSSIILPLVNQLSEKPVHNDFSKDVLGNLLQTLTVHDSGEMYKMLCSITSNISDFKNSRAFIEGFHRVLKMLSHNERLLKTLIDNESFVYEITDNLLLPDGKIRYESLKLIISFLEITGQEVSSVINDCKIIEEIPLTLQNSRDLTMRIRNMGSEFSKVEPQKLLNNIFFKFLFGLLTARFSPLWNGVYEILPTIYEKDQALVWELAVHFLNILDNNFKLNYYQEPISEAIRNPFWTVSVKRLDDIIQASDRVFNLYFFTDCSFIDIFQERRSELVYPPLIRSQTLKALLLISRLAERHSRDIVPLLFNEDESDEIFQDGETDDTVFSASSWAETDRNSLLKLFGKFKNIKSIYKFEEVHQRFMVLLSSRNTEVQRLSLDGIFAYKDPIVMKYRDNLKNLLDDTLFKDEMTKFLASDNSRIIEDADKEELMPYILRILFGRAQTPNTSGIKRSRRTAVITVLPNLKEAYIIDFLRLGSSRFKYEYFFDNGNHIEEDEANSKVLRRMVGFVNIINSSLSVLGSNFPDVMKSVIRPLIYSICMSNYVLSQDINHDFIDKVAINLRQLGMKCFHSLFEYLGETLDWAEYIADIYNNVIKPRLVRFEDENLQQPSSIMKMMTYWANHKFLYKFLYFDDYAPAKALMRTLSSDNAKETVVHVLLDYSNKIVKNPSKDTEYIGLISLTVSTCLQVLPELFKKIVSQQVSSVAIDLLLNMTEAGYIQDNETRKLLVDSLTLALEKDIGNVHMKDKVKILRSLASLITEYDCSWQDIESLYKACSKLYRVYAERDIRETLNTVFVSIGSRFENVARVSELLSNLNAYSPSRMQEYDFERVLPAFKQFTETDYKEYMEIEWLPVLYCCLFFINDKDELAIRTNATYTLNRFIDYINSKPSADVARKPVSMMKEVLLPHVRTGLRKQDEGVQNEYISVIAYIVTNSKYYTELDDMKALLFNGDEEANFFVNINHIQLHRRQRAIKRLRDYGNDLHGNSISHYLIPMIEHYAFSEEEKYRNISNETILTIGALSNYSSWNQYKALLRRYISMLKNKPDHLKEVVVLIVQVSRALKNTMQSIRTLDETKPRIRNFPSKLDEPERYIKEEVCATLSKSLATRDDETVVARIPLSEALVNLVLGLKPEDTIALLPGILTSICQVLRSRSEELREAVRKNLGHISVILGPTYLTFIIRELKAALTRGSQIHVLSYTVHHVLMSLSEVLQHGDMDDCAHIIVKITMEDIFGMAGQEKDAEGYTSKMKEVKFNKSYDTGEIMAANINLSTFATLLAPVKALLMERLALKSQKKLDELLRRYALGLNHNEESSSVDVLKLCHEIYTQSETEALASKRSGKRVSPKSEKEEFFLISLNAKTARVHTENSLFVSTMQKFSLDLLRTALSRNQNLLNVAYLEGFIPLLKDTLNSENEGVLISTLRVLIIFVKLDFPEGSEAVFKNCARKVLNIIKDSPSTSTELCQMGLKFLSSVLRHKEIELKDTALSYVLGRILPDLHEPSKQGLAFNFLKALFSKHIVLPEVYDVMDTVSEIMVTNHSKEIRDVSRSVYYQFLMEYDQSRGRLEKQFKFLVSNLEYPSQEGRQSVMELINLIVNKSGPELLMKLSASFFVSLAGVSVNDDSPRCREMAATLITNLFQKLGPLKMSTIEKYISSWLKQAENPMFLNLGLRIYKIYLSTIGLENNDALNELAINRMKAIISSTDVGSDTEWDVVYTALNVFSVYITKSENVYEKTFSSTWTKIVGCLLYPHAWVRMSAARLVNALVSNLRKLEKPLTDYELQTIAFRIFRQLGAPSLPEALSSVSLNTLVMLIMKWKSEKTAFIIQDNDSQESRYESAIDFAISRAGSIIRSEDNPAESFSSKKSSIQLFALMAQILDEAELKQSAEKFLLPLFVYLEQDGTRLDEQQEELHALAQECVQMLETKLSVADFTRSYANVKQIVTRRRQERRARKAVLAVRAPEAAANRKLKKHARSREKRKHEKDDSGYYHKKKRRA